MGKTILFGHGQSFKPAKQTLSRIWKDTTRYGIERSFSRKVRAFDAATRVSRGVEVEGQGVEQVLTSGAGTAALSPDCWLRVDRILYHLQRG